MKRRASEPIGQQYQFNDTSHSSYDESYYNVLPLPVYDDDDSDVDAIRRIPIPPIPETEEPRVTTRRSLKSMKSFQSIRKSKFYDLLKNSFGMGNEEVESVRNTLER